MAIRAQPVIDVTRVKSDRTSLSLVHHSVIVNNVESIIEAAVSRVEFIGHAVNYQRHVRWKCINSQFCCCSQTLGDCSMLVDEVVVVWKGPAVGRMCFFNVDNHKVG